MSRLPIAKTFKLFINGAFPRSESGRTMPVHGHDGGLVGHVSRASRKDLRDAVVAARKAFPGWAGAPAYLRGQILYRLAEMLEARRGEFETLLMAEGADAARAAAEVTASIDRVVCFAGWADKYAQVLGSQNPVSGPYWNFTTPQPTGVVGVVCPQSPALLGLISLLAPVVCAGNAAVVTTPAFAPVASTFGEVLATSDFPAGVVNVLTSPGDDLIPVLAVHRDVNAIFAAGVTGAQAKVLREGAAENLKRVTVVGDAAPAMEGAAGLAYWQGLGVIEPFVEYKTVWHTVGA